MLGLGRIFTDQGEAGHNECAVLIRNITRARPTPGLVLLHARDLPALATAVHDTLHSQEALAVREAGRYEEPAPTCSDALAALRQRPWRHEISSTLDYSPRHS